MDVWVLIRENTMVYEQDTQVVGVYASPEAAFVAHPDGYAWKHNIVRADEDGEEDLEWWDGCIRNDDHSYDLTRYTVQGGVQDDGTDG